MKKSVIEHLAEVRRRLLISLCSVCALFIVSLLFTDNVLSFILEDLGITVVTLAPLEIIYIELKLSALVAVVLASPIILYQVVVFVKPALNDAEKRLLLLSLPVFVLFFCIGAAFSYLVMVPIVIAMAEGLSAHLGIKAMWSVSSTLGFLFVSTVFFGLVFELPLILIVLNRLGIISSELLSKKRAYVYAGIVITAAVLTPTGDAFTLLLSSIPLLVLYELSLLVIRFHRS